MIADGAIHRVQTSPGWARSKRGDALAPSIDPFVQVTKYPGGRAPDGAVAERYGVEVEGSSV
jgi:hypothetical protein